MSCLDEEIIAAFAESAAAARRHRGARGARQRLRRVPRPGVARPRGDAGHRGDRGRGRRATAEAASRAPSGAGGAFPRNPDRTLHGAGPGRAGRHGRGLCGLRSGAGSANRAEDPAFGRGRAGWARAGAGCCAKPRRSPGFTTPTSSWCTTPGASPIASSSRWSSSTAARSRPGWASRRARRRASSRSSLPPAAACRPRTRPGSFTATSSRRT